MRRRANGEGSIYKRKDGRWAADIYVTVSGGQRKRKTIPGRKGESREDVRIRLEKIKEQERKKIPFSPKKWVLRDWLDHWLTDIVPKNVRRNIVIGYEAYVRIYLKPMLGEKSLENLSVRDVQAAIDKWHEAGVGIRTIHKVRTALSSALTRAMREELIFRNVARLVILPKYRPKAKIIWTTEQQLKFFDVAKDHRWCIGFLAGFVYGMREGEILGLRWCDIDFQNNIFSVRQQIQRLDGRIQALPLKTESSVRTLPLSNSFKNLLLGKVSQEVVDIYNCFQQNPEYSLDGLIITSKTGAPIESGNFLRAFYALIKRAGLPKIPFHTSRHIAATTHKNVGTPLCDAQGILGHSDSDITRMIYQHGDMDVQRQTIEATENMLNLNGYTSTDDNCCQKLLSNQDPAINQRIVNDKEDAVWGDIKGSDVELKWYTRRDSNARPSAPQAGLAYLLKTVPAPVIKHLWAAMRTQILGAVAVKTAVILYHDNSVLAEIDQTRLQQYVALYHACGEILKKSKISAIL